MISNKTESKYQKINDIMIQDDLNIYNYENIKEYLINRSSKKINKRRILNINTHRQYLQSILFRLKKENNDNQELKNNISKHISELSKLEKKQSEDNKMSEQEKDNYVTWNEILNVYEIIKTNKKYSEEHLLLSLYILHPPRRLNDYYNMKYMKKKTDNLDEEYNYCLLINKNKKYFTFNNYKTRKELGIQNIEINNELFLILKEYIKKNDIKVNERIFKNINTEMNYVKKIQNIFKEHLNKKNISVNLLRHIYITEKINNKNLTLKERKSIALLMAHNLHQQDAYRYIEEETNKNLPNIL